MGTHDASTLPCVQPCTAALLQQRLEKKDPAPPDPQPPQAHGPCLVCSASILGPPPAGQAHVLHMGSCWGGNARIDLRGVLARGLPPAPAIGSPWPVRLLSDPPPWLPGPAAECAQEMLWPPEHPCGPDSSLQRRGCLGCPGRGGAGGDSRPSEG